MSSQVEEPTTARQGASDPAAQRLLRAQVTPVLIATAALLVVARIVAPNTFEDASIGAIVIPTAILAIAGLGQTLVVQQQGIDLSTPGIMTLAAMEVGYFTDRVSITGALAIVLVTAVLTGAVNGLLVTRLYINPLLATLATNSILLGVVWTLTNGTAQDAPVYLVRFASRDLLGMPMMGWATLVFVALAAFFMRTSTLGRRFTGVGASPAAARASGVPVERYIIFAYVAASVSAAVAGLLLAGYATQIAYDIATSYQLSVIAAVVVGGAALTGGRGSVMATAVAALLLTAVVQTVLTLGAPASAQLLAQAVVLGLAAALRLVPWSRLRRDQSAVNRHI